ncbi:hypothetical protein MGN70_010344 [Eutypa lata]|nr:hypothetical protein MGN70_010344 [Eutypa lata]
MDSDTDSDFYGDNETKAGLKARVENYDVAARWELNAQVQMPIERQALHKLSEATMDPMDIDTPSTSTATNLHNPYAGVPYAWQLEETVDAFLARLPPSSTLQTERTPWIYICNPFTARQAAANTQQQQQVVPGCEDEAPVERGSDVRTFCQGAMERLHMASGFMEQCRRSGMGTAFVTRECAKAGADAAVEVLDLAHALRVRCGKWMLFRKAEDIDQTWEVVARATANNELGIAAKVAPRPEEESNNERSERLICVYTKDFRDLEDVRRVARELKRLGLIPPRGRPLYYKPGESAVRFSALLGYLGIDDYVPQSLMVLEKHQNKTWDGGLLGE